MLKIIGTYNKPSIYFDTETGALLIEGKSFTVNSSEFYKPLLYAIAAYKINPQIKTIAHFKLTYFNTSSSKSILDVLRELESLNVNSEVIINWYYEKGDIDMLDLGKNYQIYVKLPFHMISVEPIKTGAFSFFNRRKDVGIYNQVNNKIG